jgi:hypothetical protein
MAMAGKTTNPPRREVAAIDLASEGLLTQGMARAKFLAVGQTPWLMQNGPYKEISQYVIVADISLARG